MRSNAISGRLRFRLGCGLLLLVMASFASAQGVTYVVLWFDTEDYVDPIADDAALRIANDLTSLGVRATFKVVGEKARVLERRGRQDVIQALGKHTIGYHSDWHSIQPAPAVAIEHLDSSKVRRNSNGGSVRGSTTSDVFLASRRCVTDSLGHLGLRSQIWRCDAWESTPIWMRGRRWG